MNFLVSLTVTLCILIYAAPVFSGQCEIQIGPGWMKGKADGTPLGTVLTEVTRKAGYDIYIDEQLQEIPVSFDIQDKLAPEKAIKRIVRPHSYAVVFGSMDRDDISNILEIWVFRQDQQFTARYIDLKATSTGVPEAVSSGRNSTSGSSKAVSGGGTPVDPRKSVKRELRVKRNAYGGPAFMYGDSKKGPDYRLTPHQRQEAYRKFLLEKKQYERRTNAGMLSRSQKDSERARSEYRARRNREIRERIMDLENPREKGE